MIRVKVYKDKDDHYSGFLFDGHAGYAESGEDIVCSGVSALVFTTINAIDAFTDDGYALETNPETGTIRLMFDERPEHDAALLIDTLLLGVHSIEEEYSDYIQLEIEEV